MKRLENKVALVAGGGSIGSATVRRLAEDGCRVLLGDIALDQAEADAEEISRATGVEVIATAYDQGDDASVKRLVQTAVDHFGQLDFVHANAADLSVAGEDYDAVATDLAIYDRTMDINLRGFVLVTRHAMPHLVKSRGAIVYTGSGSAYIGEPTRFSYGMSKSGVNALMRHVATRWGPEGVRANALAPGFVLGRRDASALPEGFMEMVTAAQRIPVVGEPRHIAAMVAHLFSDDGAWITGQVIAIDGGSTMRA
ncbi:SDR family NAD(P)-dependent oxidoreductase [Flavisphingomonas formosensis]|uniref:SDR family NAD(P)-dependent oxidoreductase n=1 Tax=Flavisphingomonas formosensis TaxID=861534 RepID=UPI0012FCD692|nr:SDR family oxidoreductase [Sphingomonas formosensis]